MKVIHYDPSIDSRNQGDKYISECVKLHLDSTKRLGGRVMIPTQRPLTWAQRTHCKASDLGILGGTNILSSNMPFYSQWKISLFDTCFIKNVVLMGVGWWQYQGTPNFYTRCLLKRILSRNYLHSVRDRYTEKMLRSIGFENVLFTACPTMWSLDESRCAAIPRTSSRRVLVTITDYKKNSRADRGWLTSVILNYDEVYLYLAGAKDKKYFESLGLKKSGITLIGPDAEDLNRALCLPLDYIGTRLHIGIKSLNAGRRSLILAVDNRAMEISKDTGLPCAERSDTDAISRFIREPFDTKIHLPNEAIKKWLTQF